MTSIPGKVFAGIAIVIIFATTPLYGQTPVATKDIIIVPDDHGRPARCVAKDGSDTEIDRKICDKALARVASAAIAVTQAAPTPPRPELIGNPGDWFTPDAYPKAAIDAGLEGRTTFAIDVDANGAMKSCTIVTSSGSELLDTATCSVWRANARFKPAIDSSKRPIASVWRSGIRWVLPAPIPIEIFLDEAAVVKGCQQAVPPPGGFDPCANVAVDAPLNYVALRNALDVAGRRSVPIILRGIYGASDSAHPIGDPKAWFEATMISRSPESVKRMVIALYISTTGQVADCRMMEGSGAQGFDDRICSAAKAYGRFDPANDEHGTAQPSWFTLILPPS